MAPSLAGLGGNLTFCSVKYLVRRTFVKRHIVCTICEKIRVSTHVISELCHFLEERKRIFEFTRFAYRLFTGVLGYFGRTNRCRFNSASYHFANVHSESILLLHSNHIENPAN